MTTAAEDTGAGCTLTLDAAGAEISGSRLVARVDIPFRVSFRAGDRRYGRRFSAVLAWVGGNDPISLWEAGVGPREAYEIEPGAVLFSWSGCFPLSGRMAWSVTVRDDRGGVLVHPLELVVLDERDWPEGPPAAAFMLRTPPAVAELHVFDQGAQLESFRWRT